jgi:signal transduction histidine kinase
VKHSGIGIDPEILPNLFSRFNSKSYAGIGLGLFISKSIIQVHSGRTWGGNNSGGSGATFAFILPAVIQ